jgi:uncharacterized membrane protein
MVLLLASYFLDGVATIAGGFVGLDAGAMWSMISYGHRSAAARFRTSQMFMLKGLNKPSMSFAFLFR